MLLGRHLVLGSVDNGHSAQCTLSSFICAAYEMILSEEASILVLIQRTIYSAQAAKSVEVNIFVYLDNKLHRPDVLWTCMFYTWHLHMD